MILQAPVKTEDLDPDRFGYRSNHYVVTIKPEWGAVPEFRGLTGIRAEIQVRTLLMHAWASLSHQLSYKVEDEIPKRFRRQIFQLSAIFELADQEFDRLRSQKTAYQRALITEAKANPLGFDVKQPLSVDSLQAFLDFNFADRDGATDLASALFGELHERGVTLADLARGLDEAAPILASNEREMFKGEGGGRWARSGIVRHVLDLTHDGYWRWRHETGLPDYVVDIVEARRSRLGKNANDTQ